MKAVVAILLLAVTGAALAEPSKPAAVTTYKDGKPYNYDSARTPYRAGTPYIDDPLIMRLHAPAGFRSDALEASPDRAQDKSMPEKTPAPKSPG